MYCDCCGKEINPKELGFAKRKMMTALRVLRKDPVACERAWQEGPLCLKCGTAISNQLLRNQEV